MYFLFICVTRSVSVEGSDRSKTAKLGSFLNLIDDPYFVFLDFSSPRSESRDSLLFSTVVIVPIISTTGRHGHPGPCTDPSSDRYAYLKKKTGPFDSPMPMVFLLSNVWSN